MRNLTPSHVTAPDAGSTRVMPSLISPDGDQESDLESLWSRPGVALESLRRPAGGRMTHKSRSRVAGPRPISGTSMWIVRA
jgi:hypothetical protein